MIERQAAACAFYAPEDRAMGRRAEDGGFPRRWSASSQDTEWLPRDE